MVTNLRLVRLLQGVRRWRGATQDAAIAVRADLPDGDLRRLRSIIDDSISARGGEVAARRRAKSIGLTYASLDPAGQRRFFEVLADEYGHDDTAVDEAIAAVIDAAGAGDARRRAETELRLTLRPRRELLLRRFAGIGGGFPFLIEMREDLLSYRKGSTALRELDDDLRRILERWFDVALLHLDRLTWNTPAAVLEKLIAYEAVHAIESWDDLRRRLGPGRRCYAFVHPAMPDDPLIFVEVALTKGMADSVIPFVTKPDDPESDDDESDTDESDADTAIFYSISNCHKGLAGVSLGDFLIKSVVEDLSGEMPNIKNFATLSPLPGFRGWLSTKLAAGGPVLAGGEAHHLVPADPRSAHDHLQRLIDGPMPSTTDPDLERARPVLLRLAAWYVTNERRSSAGALDPVTHFHLSNGARAERLNWLANPTEVGWERGLGIMINYRYDLREIERNLDRYVGDDEVAASDQVGDLIEPMAPSRD